MSLFTATLVLLGSLLGSWPLNPPPQVARPFQPPSTLWGAGHRGVDLRGEVGQEVLATAPGTVIFAARVVGVGVVVVSHGDTRTTYQPVTAVVVPGQAVTAGQQIGVLDAAGSHCAPDACLHWGLLRGAQYLDPLTMLVTADRVRLLPLDAPPASPSESAAGAHTVSLPAPSAGLPQIADSVIEALSAALRAALPSAPLPVTPAGAPAGTPSSAGQP